MKLISCNCCCRLVLVMHTQHEKKKQTNEPTRIPCVFICDLKCIHFVAGAYVLCSRLDEGWLGGRGGLEKDCAQHCQWFWGAKLNQRPSDAKMN